MHSWISVLNWSGKTVFFGKWPFNPCVQYKAYYYQPCFEVKTSGVSFNSWMFRLSQPSLLHLNIVPSCSHLWSFTANSIPLNELPFPHFIWAQHDPQIGPCKFSPIWLLLSLCQTVHNRSVKMASRHHRLLWGSAESEAEKCQSQRSLASLPAPFM